MTDAIELAPRKQNRSSEELDMRALIVPELRKRWPGARIIHELPLRYSTNRIDLAAVTEAEIVSIEIKSSRDVMTRLEGQLRAFKPISSRIIAALAPCWNEQLPMIETKIRYGTCYSPQYTPTQELIHKIGGIEVWTVGVTAGTVKVTDGGPYRANKPWLAQMLDMLHVSELEAIAHGHQIAVAKRPTHLTLVTDLVDMLQGREVVKAVCRALRSRNAFDKASDAPILTYSVTSKDSQ
ncbi:hypothetical protein [Bradyrhizobium sp. 18]|uniref:hypothetical protein n=1 Tax=Bradyrhizobium sp. 18 TaxID=2782657 RepID=UPI001FFB720B|nr:hypothetical protein [Bradyrhizobium sp. 18]MCK1503908.1 hypothetical protein [Bradyrhizobium sp. 18]